jgi:poly-gamma-glutamate synthesis protein (capsule biosynthesis protein)
MLSRGVRAQILAAKDPSLPFRKVAPLTAAADITFLNLESPFSDKGPYHATGLIFHAAPEMVAGLELAGVDVASTANNHARDCGAHGVEFTLAWLRSHEILPVGSADTESAAHAGVVLNRQGVRFGFLGYTYDQKNGNWKEVDPRIAMADGPAMDADVRRLRPNCDVLIVSMHHGIEYQTKPNREQMAFAHAAIDAGADLVIGHHPHVIQPREVYRGKPIYYSLGNFIFDQFQRQATQRGEMVEISFLGREILSERTLPVKITRTGPELEANSAAAGPLDVTTELRTHGREYLLRERMLQAGAEARK